MARACLVRNNATMTGKSSWTSRGFLFGIRRVDTQLLSWSLHYLSPDNYFWIDFLFTPSLRFFSFLCRNANLSFISGFPGSGVSSLGDTATCLLAFQPYAVLLQSKSAQGLHAFENLRISFDLLWNQRMPSVVFRHLYSYVKEKHGYFPQASFWMKEKKFWGKCL